MLRLRHALSFLLGSDAMITIHPTNHPHNFHDIDDPNGELKCWDDYYYATGCIPPNFPMPAIPIAVTFDSDFIGIWAVWRGPVYYHDSHETTELGSVNYHRDWK